VEFSGQRWVMLAQGIHDIAPDTEIELFLDTRHLMAFDTHGHAIGEAA
jgi:glycerol transport system ATP-binding protein